jgi:ATP-dependent DNA helicase RecQ
LRRFIADSDNAEVEYAKLERMQQFAEALSCRRIALLNYFGEPVYKNCGNCDICKRPPQYFDGTVLTQKICSAVARLKESEAMGMVVDVLRGAQNAQVFDNGYQKVKTYGAVKEISWLDLQQYVIQLLNQGILEINFREGSRIALTPSAKQVLFEGKPVRLAVLEKEKFKPKKERKTSTKPSGLFEKLRLLRQQIAMEANVPAYVVFSDSSLRDMEEKLPYDEADFLEISGVGKSKLEKYAAVFLKEINRHKRTLEASDLPTHELSFSLFNEGLPVEKIARKRGVAETTVYSHFLKIAEEGKSIDFNQFLSDQEIENIKKAQAELDEPEGLRPYFDHFEEQMPYWKIKIGLYLAEK